MSFRYKLNDAVSILGTANEGTVVARAEYADGTPNGYWVRYTNTDDELRKCWFNEEEISIPD